MHDPISGIVLKWKLLYCIAEYNAVRSHKKTAVSGLKRRRIPKEKILSVILKVISSILCHLPDWAYQLLHVLLVQTEHSLFSVAVFGLYPFPAVSNVKFIFFQYFTLLAFQEFSSRFITSPDFPFLFKVLVIVTLPSLTRSYQSSSGPKGRQGEPHTHMENKRKPMSWFSHGYHG